jgi:ABC-type uncharacterized transport system auxiliary subunit
MHSTAKFFALAAVLVFALAGCQSHQAKIDALQQEHDRISQQFAKDCSAELLKVPPTQSQKCVDEDKQMKDAWDRLQAERMKQ